VPIPGFTGGLTPHKRTEIIRIWYHTYRPGETWREDRNPRPRLASREKNMFLTYVMDIEAFFKHTEARMEYCVVVLPASATVEVRRSVHADSLVEVEAVAITD
jgi:hypothetical protein